MAKKINSNQPLPSNTKVSCDNCFAKLMLETFDNKHFKNLTLDDKPDLQSDLLNLGIEVTTAVNQNDNELDSLYTSLSYGTCRNENAVSKKIEHLGGKIRNGVLSHPVRNWSLENIFDAFNEKLKKISSGGYRMFEKNYLFITDSIFIGPEHYDIILNKMIYMQKDNEIQFDKVFIYIYGVDMYEFDLSAMKVKKFNVSNNAVYNVSIQARKLVIKNENTNT